MYYINLMRRIDKSPSPKIQSEQLLNEKRKNKFLNICKMSDIKFYGNAEKKALIDCKQVFKGLD
jgi:hypothetical protein